MNVERLKEPAVNVISQKARVNEETLQEGKMFLIHLAATTGYLAHL
jgi:hypothetical protein